MSAGGNLLALARMFGHEDPSVTLKVYADLFYGDLPPLTLNPQGKRARYAGANCLAPLGKWFTNDYAGRGGGI